MNRSFPQKECINTESALRKEWIDTNGLGGYSSSTIIDCHTRKYHGLLVAALKSPKGKFVLVSKLEPSVVVDGKEYEFSTNKYPGIFHPTGHQFQESFDQSVFPSITYRLGDAVIKKTTAMISGENTVMVQFELLKGRVPLTLRLKPLLAYRGIHELTHQNLFLRVNTFFEKNGFKIDPYDSMPPLYMVTNRKSTFYPGPHWINHVEYLKEQRRGFDYQEDLFCPGIFEVELKKGADVIFCASVTPPKSLPQKLDRERQQRIAEFRKFSKDDTHLQNLKFQASQFLIKNQYGESSVCAGYHWFGEWGRDSIIATPGLTFYCGRMDTGFEILRTFAKREKNGLLPNFISEDTHENAYNSIDASLWFFWAIQEYLKKNGSRQKVRDFIYPVLTHIVAAFLQGKIPLCAITREGFLHTGNEETQLTWMDATAYGKPVTPRNGCPVEINALWYNALKFYLDLSTEFEKNETLCSQVLDTAARIEQAFGWCFWSEKNNCLGDVYREYGLDERIRPNQIFTVSLPFSPISQEMKRKVLTRVTSDLLVPFGLRTLSPSDEEYRSRYEGNGDERDSAYHQGTVWPWLLGHYGEAYLKMTQNHERGCKFLRDRLNPILQNFPEDFGIASIPEIYNGNPPHTPKGCIAQAWSVAEIIRLLCLMKGN